MLLLTLGAVLRQDFLREHKALVDFENKRMKVICGYDRVNIDFLNEKLNDTGELLSMALPVGKEWPHDWICLIKNSQWMWTRLLKGN